MTLKEYGLSKKEAGELIREVIEEQRYFDNIVSKSIKCLMKNANAGIRLKRRLPNHTFPDIMAISV